MRKKQKKDDMARKQDKKDDGENVVDTSMDQRREGNSKQSPIKEPTQSTWWDGEIGLESMETEEIVHKNNSNRSIEIVQMVKVKALSIPSTVHDITYKRRKNFEIREGVQPKTMVAQYHANPSASSNMQNLISSGYFEVNPTNKHKSPPHDETSHSQENMMYTPNICNLSHYPNLTKLLERRYMKKFIHLRTMQRDQLATKTGEQAISPRLEYGRGETRLMRMEGQQQREPMVTEIITQEGSNRRWKENEDNRRNKEEEQRKRDSEKEESTRHYIVESPTESPEKERAIITVETGLSSLLQKVNLKREHEEEMESDVEEPNEIQLNKFITQQEEGSSIDGKRNLSRSNRKGLRRKNETSRRIFRGTRQGTNDMGYDGVP